MLQSICQIGNIIFIFTFLIITGSIMLSGIKQVPLNASWSQIHVYILICYIFDAQKLFTWRKKKKRKKGKAEVPNMSYPKESNFNTFHPTT